MQDLTTDDDILASDEPTDAELAKQFTHPGYSFKGEALRPYTSGTDLLFHQVLDQNDAAMTLFLSFIFIHRAGIDRAALLGLCWDKTKFRGALLDWIDSLGVLTTEDKDEATRLFEKMREAARKASVEVIPDATEKKTKARRRQK